MKKQIIQKRTKVDGKYRRYYSSGIPMYRERFNPIKVPANTLVTVLKPGPRNTLCQLPAKFDDFIVLVPTEHLPGMNKLVDIPRELQAVTIDTPKRGPGRPRLEVRRGPGRPRKDQYAEAI